MSSCIDNITCPQCGGDALREQYNDTGAIHIWCPQCKYEDINETSSDEKCPNCDTELCHITIKNEDVFGCPACQKEVCKGNSK
jgi:formamidopyrimidine-DNA glycosylase